MKKILIALCCIGLLSACKNENEKNTERSSIESAESQKTQTKQESAWISLFDGKSAEGWRAYNGKEGDNLPTGWVIEEGTLKSLGKGGDLGGDIIYGAEKFENFELELQWKLSEGGNSGIFYHVVEDSTQESPYWAAPEYQIIDQLGFPQKLEAWQSIGADYGMYNPTYAKEDLKPMGEWNTSKIRFTPDKVTYWLNGKETVSFVPWSEDWEERKASGKWKDYPDYGTTKTGYIGLQDHGSPIWFKDIKIKKL